MYRILPAGLTNVPRVTLLGHLGAILSAEEGFGNYVY